MYWDSSAATVFKEGIKRDSSSQSILICFLFFLFLFLSSHHFYFLPGVGLFLSLFSLRLTPCIITDKHKHHKTQQRFILPGPFLSPLPFYTCFSLLLLTHSLLLIIIIFPIYLCLIQYTGWMHKRTEVKWHRHSWQFLTCECLACNLNNLLLTEM